jgi:hypothetical protein
MLFASGGTQLLRNALAPRGETFPSYLLDVPNLWRFVVGSVGRYLFPCLLVTLNQVAQIISLAAFILVADLQDPRLKTFRYVKNNGHALFATGSLSDAVLLPSSLLALHVGKNSRSWHMAMKAGRYARRIAGIFHSLTDHRVGAQWHAARNSVCCGSAKPSGCPRSHPLV